MGVQGITGAYATEAIVPGDLVAHHAACALRTTTCATALAAAADLGRPAPAGSGPGNTTRTH